MQRFHILSLEATRRGSDEELIVVEFDKLIDVLTQFFHRLCRVQVDVLHLDGTPETLYPDVVLAAAAAIHADPDAESLACGQPLAARILAALVGIDDLWCPMGFHGHLEHLYAVPLVRRVVQPPGHDTVAVDVHYRRQVHEPVQHRYIGDVNAPDLIGTGYFEATEQIGHPVLRLAELGQALPRVYRGDAHLAHQPADTFRADNEAQQGQMIHHALHTLGGMIGVFPASLPHHLKALRGLTLGLVVVCPLADAEKLQLAVHAQPAAGGY